MKKQYRLDEVRNFKYDVELYHDGKLFKVLNIWQDEITKETDKLEEQGYEYGFTKEEVEEAKYQYERMLEFLIGD